MKPELAPRGAGGDRDGAEGGEGGNMQIPLFKKLPFEKVCHIPARARNPRANGITAASSPSWDGAGGEHPPPAATRDRGCAPAGKRSRRAPQSPALRRASHAGTPEVGIGPSLGPLALGLYRR